MYENAISVNYIVRVKEYVPALSKIWMIRTNIVVHDDTVYSVLYGHH